MDVLIRARLFSLRDANALVPLLQRTFARARTLREQLGAEQKTLQAAGLPADPDAIEVDPAAPASVQRAQSRAIALRDELRDCLREVIELGIEVKAADGLCDFRSRHAGRVVYLCWRYGEERITHFHELDAGFAGRKPLPEGGEFVGELLH